MDIEYGPTTGTPENESFEVGQESKEDNESPQTGSGVESTVSAIKI